MGLRTQPVFFTAGNGGRLGGINDQCGSYSAPFAIQRFSISFWASVNFFLVLGGGIKCDLLSDKMRSIRELFSTSPGTMASDLMASSRRSRRRSALRAALSAPWQAKQFSAKMGRTSWL